MNSLFPMPTSMNESGRGGLESHLDGPWRNESRILAGPLHEPAPAWFLEAMRRRGYQVRPMGEMLEFRR